MKKIVIAFTFSVFSLAVFAQQPPQPPTPEQRSAHLKERFKTLQLTPGQQVKFDAAFKTFFENMESLRGQIPPPPPPPAPATPPAPPAPPTEIIDEVHNKLMQFSTERNAAVKKILSAEQYIKFLEIETTVQNRKPHGRPPVPPAPPQLPAAPVQP